jgi:hypothetical protein
LSAQEEHENNKLQTLAKCVACAAAGQLSWPADCRGVMLSLYLDAATAAGNAAGYVFGISSTFVLSVRVGAA